MKTNYEDIEFFSENVLLRGRFYLGQGSKLSPSIIMSHGTSATITMGINQYAEKFQEKGFNVLLYDHEGIGLSEGKPQLMNPWIQGRGYKNAYNYLKNKNYLHNNKFLFWGESFSGMLVLVVGALIKGVSGIISVTPSCGAEQIKFKNRLEGFNTLKNIFFKGNLDDYSNDIIGPIAVVSNNQEKPSLLVPKEAYDWFMALGKSKNSKWKNIITRVVPRTEVPFTPQLTASFINSPTLIITGKNDEIIQANLKVQKEVYKDIPSEKKLIEINGGHFGCLYPESSCFQENINFQLSFLNKFK
ncbi:alpha/beta hydrolase [Pelagibacteraceae bacterium]|nr:alpha/beta hydrolase [Pelagibacteraceae bacterium]